MFGILGALIFGTICTGAWINADNTERKNRNNSRDSGRDFYIDKNGRMRHTENGRKFTPEEIHQSLFPKSLAELNEEYDKKTEDLMKKRFYATISNKFIEHFFLTKEDAIRFLEKYNKSQTYEFSYMRLHGMYSKLEVRDFVRCGGICHFDYDKYIGDLDVPWEKKRR